MEGDHWCPSLEGYVPLSNLDGVEFLKGDSEFPLLQWKHSEPITCGLSHGETGSALLECSPLSRGSGSSPFPFEMETVQFTVGILFKMIHAQKMSHVII